MSKLPKRRYMHQTRHGMPAQSIQDKKPQVDLVSLSIGDQTLFLMFAVISPYILSLSVILRIFINV